MSPLTGTDAPAKAPPPGEEEDDDTMAEPTAVEEAIKDDKDQNDDDDDDAKMDGPATDAMKAAAAMAAAGMHELTGEDRVIIRMRRPEEWRDCVSRTPDETEQICAQLFKRMGFDNAEALAKEARRKSESGKDTKTAN